MISINKVSKIYSDGENCVTALKNISIELPDKGLVCFVGESGSGKTTLLNLIGAADIPTEGQILINENNINNFSEEQYHNEEVSFIFQNYNVFDELTVYDNIKVALDILDIDETRKNEIINDILNRVGLSELINKKVSQLSGGQKQRVAIARACAKQPRFILADEPTGNLDSENSKNIFELLKSLSNKLLIVCVTHNRKMAEQFSDRIIELKDGQVYSDIANTNAKFKLIYKIEDIGLSTDNIGDITKYLKSEKNNKNSSIIHVDKVPLEEKVDTTENITSRYNLCSPERKMIINLSKKLLNKRKKRNLINAVIIMLTSYMLLLIVNFITYSSERSIKNYLSKYNITENVFEKTYVDKKNGESNTLYVSKEIDESIECLDYDYKFYQFSDYALSIGSNSSNGEDDFDENFKTMSVNCKVIPSNKFKKMISNDYCKNGIVITSYIANKLGAKINDIVSINGNDFVVLEIIKTNVSDMIEEDREYNLQDFYSKSQNCYCYISDDYNEYFDLYKNSRIYLGANFLANSLFGYVCNEVLLVPETTEKKLIKGRMPQKNGEVIVSGLFLQEYEITSEEALEATYSLKDISNYKEYGELINLYDICNGFVKIVGIAEFDGDIILSNEDYSRISKLYNDLYKYSNIGVHTSKYNSLAKMLSKNKLHIVDPFLEKVYTIETVKNTMRIYLIIASILLVIVNLLIISSTAHYEIRDNAEKIGILRSLGYPYDSINKIFLRSILRVFIISVVGSIILIGITIVLLNRFSFVVQYRPYSVININLLSTVLTLLFATGCGFFVSRKSINVTKKMTIINTINCNRK